LVRRRRLVYVYVSRRALQWQTTEEEEEEEEEIGFFEAKRAAAISCATCFCDQTCASNKRNHDVRGKNEKTVLNSMHTVFL
jgi:hypothetical protein